MGSPSISRSGYIPISEEVIQLNSKGGLLHKNNIRLP